MQMHMYELIYRRRALKYVFFVQTAQQKEHFKAIVKTGLHFDKAKKTLELKSEDIYRPVQLH